MRHPKDDWALGAMPRQLWTQSRLNESYPSPHSGRLNIPWVLFRVAESGPSHAPETPWLYSWLLWKSTSLFQPFYTIQQIALSLLSETLVAGEINIFTWATPLHLYVPGTRKLLDPRNAFSYGDGHTTPMIPSATSSSRREAPWRQGCLKHVAVLQLLTQYLECSQCFLNWSELTFFLSFQLKLAS